MQVLGLSDIPNERKLAAIILELSYKSTKRGYPKSPTALRRYHLVTLGGVGSRFWCPLWLGLIHRRTEDRFGGHFDRAKSLFEDFDIDLQQRIERDRQPNPTDGEDRAIGEGVIAAQKAAS